MISSVWHVKSEMFVRLYVTNPRPRPGAVARRTNPTSKEPWLRGRRRA